MKKLKTAIKDYLAHSSLWLFLKELVQSPAAVGAAIPSSKSLADAIADQVKVDNSGYVIELGPGTGVVTAALLAKGIDPEKLIVIERSTTFSEHLKKHFPMVTIIEGNASDLAKLLGTRAPVHTIVSSLPLRSLPRAEVKEISAELSAFIKQGARFIQFTYSWKPQRQFLEKGIVCIDKKPIWKNIPPAQVMVYEYQA